MAQPKTNETSYNNLQQSKTTSDYGQSEAVTSPISGFSTDHFVGGIKAVMEKYLWNGTCSVLPFGHFVGRKALTTVSY